jgi:hypothetical protein
MAPTALHPFARAAAGALVGAAALGGFVLFGAACATYTPPPQRTITENVTSSPSGAEIWAGPNEHKLTYWAKTPASDSNTGTSPSWNPWVYQARKKGYRTQTIHQAGGTQSRNIHFDLVPVPPIPTPPLVDYPAAESVAITEVKLDSNAKKRLPRAAKVAIMAFKEPGGSGAGSLVADTMILKMQLAGFDNVVDRDQIDQVMREQGLMAEDKTALSDLEVSKRLGEVLQADFFVFGAITEYASKSENVRLSPVIKPEEADRYQREHAAYQAYYQDAEESAPERAKTLQEWEIDYASKAKSSYINIARVGVTAKIIDVKTSKIAWVGFASVSDMRLQDASKRIVEAMITGFAE